MFDIIRTANEMLKSEPQFCREILFQFCAEYQVCVDDLPNIDTLRSFVESIPKSDWVRIEFEETSSLSYVIVDSGCMEQYESFVNDLYDDDEIAIKIVVKKHVDHGVLNVYKTDEFVRFLTSCSSVQSLSNFATLFKKNRQEFSVTCCRDELAMKRTLHNFFSKIVVQELFFQEFLAY